MLVVALRADIRVNLNLGEKMAPLQDTAETAALTAVSQN